MVHMLNSVSIILLLLILTFQIISIKAIACHKYKITHSVKNDNVEIIFPSTSVTSFNQTIQCRSNSSFEYVHGPVYRCTGFGYGQEGKIVIQMIYNNGTIDNCSITYMTELQPANLIHLNVADTRVRLLISRPQGSFDYVIIYCPNNQSHIVFNTSSSSDASYTIVYCSSLHNMPLLSFVFETVKKDFDSAVEHVIQEVPLPAQLTYDLDPIRLTLTLMVSPAPSINLDSRYEFDFTFLDKHNQSITYQREKILHFNLKSNRTLKYGLLPNLKHQIHIDHIVDSIGFARSNLTITPLSNIPYPYEIVNLTLYEDSHKIILTWTDPHCLYDPIEFSVLCNSSQNYIRNVGRNTSYTCEQMTLHETDLISIQTQVAIPGYVHDRVAIVQINAKQIPEIPKFEAFHKTENSIILRWNYSEALPIPNTFQYKIQCAPSSEPREIDIYTNEYQCQSLEDGTFYVITMYLVNTKNTIKRSRSLNAATSLQKCQYKHHFYTVDSNGALSVIIEWIPPKNNFDKITVYCPSTSITYEYYQVISIMFVKCKVTRGSPYSVSFLTMKSGFEEAALRFMDTAPLDVNNTTIIMTSLSTSTSTWTPMTTSSDGHNTTNSTPQTTTTRVPTMTSTWTLMTTSSDGHNTTNSTPKTSTTRVPTMTSTREPVTTRTSSTSVSSGGTYTTTSYNGMTVHWSTTFVAQITQWRTAAIIAIILGGFLFLAIIALVLFLILTVCRNG